LARRREHRAAARGGGAERLRELRYTPLGCPFPPLREDAICACREQTPQPVEISLSCYLFWFACRWTWVMTSRVAL